MYDNGVRNIVRPSAGPANVNAVPSMPPPVYNGSSDLNLDPSGKITSYSSSYAEYSYPSYPLSILKNSVFKGFIFISNKTGM